MDTMHVSITITAEVRRQDIAGRPWTGSEATAWLVQRIRSMDYNKCSTELRVRWDRCQIVKRKINLSTYPQD